jgi:hypothetical protein
MGRDWDIFRRSTRDRRGLSFVEFVGCLLAMGSGLVGGSLYLGVDVKTMFVGILERAELVEPGFFGYEAVAENSGVSNGSGGGQSSDGATSGQLASKEIDPQRQAATELYWHGLTASIREDVSHRKLDSRGDKQWQLFDYLSHRREGHQDVVQAIESLDQSQVDQGLLAHGEQLLEWHRTGIDVYSQAVKLLADSSGDQLSGPLAKEWRSAAQQHRMEEKLLREKHAAVASYLNSAFQSTARFERGF